MTNMHINEREKNYVAQAENFYEMPLKHMEKNNNVMNANEKEGRVDPGDSNDFILPNMQYTPTRKKLVLKPGEVHKLDKFLNRIYSKNEVAKEQKEEILDKINHLDMVEVEEELKQLEKLAIAQSNVENAIVKNNTNVNEKVPDKDILSIKIGINDNDDVRNEEILKLTQMLTNLKKEDAFDHLEQLKEFQDDLIIEKRSVVGNDSFNEDNVDVADDNDDDSSKDSDEESSFLYNDDEDKSTEEDY